MPHTLIFLLRGDTMLYKVGNVADALSLDGIVPDDVHNDIVRGLSILDDEYGANRNCSTDGGYALIAQTREDVCQALRIIGERPYEWVIKLAGSGWVNTLYLLGDDFAVVLYAPESAMPIEMLNKLEVM